MSDENQACEVPLIEQLRDIPKDYRTVRAIQWSDDGRETGHQFIPVGYMMHRAADKIERAEKAIDEHNKGCLEACGKTSSHQYVKDSRRCDDRRDCPDCPKEWLIEWPTISPPQVESIGEKR